MRYRASEDGFTLSELLVTLTVLAILSTLLMGSLQLAGRARAAAEANSDSVGRMLHAQTFLRAQLSQVVARRAAGEGPLTAGASGTGGELRFLAPWLTSVGQGAIFAFTLGVEGGDLVISWEPMDREVADNVGPEVETFGRRVLATGVSGFSVAYFGRPERGAEPAWLDRWEDTRTLPRLVRIEASAGGKRWPVLVVALPT